MVLRERKNCCWWWRMRPGNATNAFIYEKTMRRRENFSEIGWDLISLMEHHCISSFDSINCFRLEIASISYREGAMYLGRCVCIAVRSIRCSLTVRLRWSQVVSDTLSVQVCLKLWQYHYISWLDASCLLGMPRTYRANKEMRSSWNIIGIIFMFLCK